MGIGRRVTKRRGGRFFGRFCFLKMKKPWHSHVKALRGTASKAMAQMEVVFAQAVSGGAGDNGKGNEEGSS